MDKTEFDNKVISEIKEKALKSLMNYGKQNDVLGSQVFSILEQEATVLYYPVQDNNIWGFTKKIKDKVFVWINTAIAFEDQVLTAAYVLYHTWYDNKDGIIMERDERLPNNERETIAERFATEFLINENLLEQQIITYHINTENLRIQEILRLSNIFTVPYDTMVRRLYEIGRINKEVYDQLISFTEQEIEIWRNRLGFRILSAENDIATGNLVDLALKVYEEKIITIERLEYLLSLANFKLEDMGIDYTDTNSFPTHEELDEIMNENI